MIDVRSAIIAAIAVLAVVGIGYLLWMRRSSLNGDREQIERTQEDLRMESKNAQRPERVGFTTRARVQPTTTLLFFGSVAAFLLVILVGAYQMAKSGSPSEMAYADQIEFAISILIAVAAGVWFKMRLDSKAGELNITYEGETSNASETYYYDRNLVQPLFDDKGDRDALLVPVFKKNRILGLFWSPKLTADDDKARDLDKNLPGDQVTYEVPLDQSSTWDQEEARITVRAKDDSLISNPDRRATYEFVPSDRKSGAEIQTMKDEIEQLRKHLDHERRLNGTHTEMIEAMEEALENRNHGSLEHLDDAKKMFLDIIESVNTDHDRRSDRSESRNDSRDGVLTSRSTAKAE
ncbi:hypothetical protein [Halosolutus gelatinilyticus]|uniref:hypothetical protein n=1 Tax=Halosolutus gelatinilyticus TaxID=2931975 RepID=UPI001FF4E354|nr:hypothetical protein [Halosolutus gelatinilyticus]